jgi:hypothetical protein
VPSRPSFSEFSTQQHRHLTSLCFNLFWLRCTACNAGESVHSEAAVPAAGDGQGGVHPGDGRRVEGAEAAAPQAGGGVRQGREAVAAGPRGHGPAPPPGEHEGGRAPVPAGRQGVVGQGRGVGALQPGLPVPARKGPRVPSPQLTA